MSDLDDFDEPQCLKHGFRWHARFQQLLNILRPKLTKQNFYKIANAVCTCVADQNDVNFRALPERRQNQLKKKPKDSRWEEQITDTVTQETFKYFDDYIESNYEKTTDEYGHLKNILKVLKERGQLSNKSTSANRFLYIFYKLMKDNDTSLLEPPQEPKKETPMEAAAAPLPLEKCVIHLKTLRPEDVGNYIGTKGIHIKRLLKEKKGSKITMGKEEGHVKIEVEALREDLQEIKDRLLQREALVNQARRQHEEQVRQYMESMGQGGSPDTMDYQSAEENMDE